MLMHALHLDLFYMEMLDKALSCSRARFAICEWRSTHGAISQSEEDKGTLGAVSGHVVWYVGCDGKQS